MNLSVCGLLAQFRPYIQHYLYIGSIISFDRRVQPPPTPPDLRSTSGRDTGVDFGGEQ